MLDKRQAKIGGLVVGVFLVAGIGLGLTGYIGMGFAGDAFISEGDDSGFGAMFVALIFFQSAIVTLFAGPLVASLAGMIAGYSIKERTPSVIASGGGSFIGFFVMVFIAIFIMALGMPEMGGNGGGGGGNGGSPADFGQLLSPMIKTALPTTASGIGAGILGTYFSNE